MPQFLVPDRKQLVLLTQVDLSSVASPGSAVAIIDEMVEALDTCEIESQYDVASESGRPPFHPKTLLKVALLALQSCRFSLRKMEEDTRNNLAYKWLTGDVVIDHSTMGYFLARFHQEIVELFGQVVRICEEQELLNFDLLAIDSMKLRANANYKRSKTLEGLSKEEAALEHRIGELLRGAGEEQDARELKTLQARKAKVDKAKRVLAERIETKTQKASPKEIERVFQSEKVNITDTDARIMQQANGENNTAYSITTTTDVGSDVVTHFQVNEQNDDVGALIQAIKGSRRKTGRRHEEVEADAGFSSIENYAALESDRQNALIPDRFIEVGESGTQQAYSRNRFRYQRGNDAYRCPEGKTLRKSGTRTYDGRRYDRYQNPKACAQCGVRRECTTADYRTILRDHQEDVRDRMRHRLKLKRSKKRYNQRAHAAEAQYGNVKWNLKFRAVFRRGRDKIAMEVALLFMLHNFFKIARSSAWA